MSTRPAFQGIPYDITRDEIAEIYVRRDRPQAVFDLLVRVKGRCHLHLEGMCPVHLGKIESCDRANQDRKHNCRHDREAFLQTTPIAMLLPGKPRRTVKLPDSREEAG